MAALLILAQTTSTKDEQINKLWCIAMRGYYSSRRRNEALIHTSTWISLEDIMLREVSQTQKHTFYTIPLEWGL